MSSSNGMKYLLGPFLKTYLCWSTNRGIRIYSASGGVASTLLKLLLEGKHVDAVLVPKPRFKQGLVYGIWTIVTNPSDIPDYSGSLYAPVYRLSKVLNHALRKFNRYAISALPCHVKAIEKILQLRGQSRDVFVIGLYCENTPSAQATKYALKFLGIRADNVEWVKFRGSGWPGYTTIKTKRGVIQISSPTFWGSGFGQYFYGLGCHLCSDQTNPLADLSLADPWTLPHEPIERLGGATLVVVRTRRGLEVFEGAVKAGYIGAIEVDPVYAVQDATLLKLSRRVLGRSFNEYVLLPSFTTIAYEVLYHVGRFLASREGLWTLLRLYHRVVRPLALKVASILDYRLQTTWAEVNTYIKLLQKTRVPREIYSLAGLELDKRFLGVNE